MFSGIIEAVSTIVAAESGNQVTRISVKKPSYFNDIKNGDSIAVDGVCLTLEAFDENSMQFALAFETLRLLGLRADQLKGRQVNLERSLRFGDRIHGHLVSGHVDSLGKVVLSRPEGDSWLLDVEVADSLRPLFWKKGSITLNGVSLTVNAVVGNRVSVCLIPETIQRTNLSSLKFGDNINVEPDMMARAMLRAIEVPREI